MKVSLVCVTERIAMGQQCECGVCVCVCVSELPAGGVLRRSAPGRW